MAKEEVFPVTRDQLRGLIEIFPKPKGFGELYRSSKRNGCSRIRVLEFLCDEKLDALPPDLKSTPNLENLICDCRRFRFFFTLALICAETGKEDVPAAKEREKFVKFKIFLEEEENENTTTV